VLWRFFAPYEIDDALEEKLLRREKRASIAISFILALLGLSIIVTAGFDLSRGQEVPEGIKAEAIIAFLSIFIFGGLSVIKFHFAEILESPSLYKDGICSLIGTVLSGALFINTLIIDKASSVWWLDPIVAVGAGIAAIVIGAKSIHETRYKENLPIFTLSWWMLSQGDGTVEGTEDKDANGDSITPRANNDEEESEMV
jgi:hypothetical protein